MVLGAILGIAGDQLTRFASAYPNYVYSKKLQDDAQEHAEYLSNTAHQREVVDLRKSGINPIYTATGGSGASSPTASSGTINSATGIDPINALSAFVNMKNQTNATKAEVNLKQAQSQDYISQMNERLQRIDYLRSQTNITDRRRALLDTEEKQLNSSIRALDAQARSNRANARQIEESLQDYIENMRANTKFTNERSRGRSFGKNEGYSYGGLGFHWSQNHGTNEIY